MHREYFYYYWGPLLYRSSIDDNMYNFLTDCIQKEYNETDRFKHGIIKIKDEYELKKQDKVKFAELFQPYLNDYKELYHTQWNPGDERYTNEELYASNVWINFQKANEYRSPHYHSGCELSYVIYYDVPEILEKEASEQDNTHLKPGAIIFRNELMDHFQPSYIKIGAVPHMPKSKEVFIFPSYLSHEVNSFKSNCTRISIAGNARFVGKEY